MIPALIARADRRLPRGVAHMCIQFIIWMAFYFAYNITRGLADRDVSLAFENGEAIARAEERLGLLFEPMLQGLVVHPLMLFLTTWSYWLSQFVIVGVALAWVYFRRHERFAFFRNWLIVANVTGLVCYVLIPTAPPRMLPRWGFTDTLADHHDSVSSLANQYAAMPSLHAMDALIVGVVMFGAVRSCTAKIAWLAWPAWIIFVVLATSNHYWLDIVAGIAIALPAAALSAGTAEPTSRGDLAEADLIARENDASADALVLEGPGSATLP
jgi:membrane-associated phospholipid phosphatase